MKKVALLTSLALSISLPACTADSENDSIISSEKTTETITKVSEITLENKQPSKSDNGKKVYFAGPLFNQSEKDYNVKIAKILEEYGYEVFLPQRDGYEAALLEGKTEAELIDMIFGLDESKVRESDILFMNLDGRVPDEGACVELGIAFASGKRCYGFKTDTRAAEQGMDLNPMISGCMTKIFSNYNGDKMIKELKEYLSNNEL